MNWEEREEVFSNKINEVTKQRNEALKLLVHLVYSAIDDGASEDVGDVVEDAVKVVAPYISSSWPDGWNLKQTLASLRSCDD